MDEEPDDGLPSTLHDWVKERAAASGENPTDVLTRAVALYRLVDEHDGDGDDPPAADLDATLERLTEQVSDLDGRVETVEDDLEQKITDVRERVIQVKREADVKAPADHDHPTLHERVEGVDQRLSDLETDVDSVGTRVDRGFENYEDVLSHLTDETEDLDRKLTRLASVVVSLRRRTATAERQLTRMDAVADLKETANRYGDAKAKCEQCGGSVAIGLLSEPTCPHCESGFVDVERSGRLFGAATLRTGKPPALTAGDDEHGGETDPTRNGRQRDDGETNESQSRGADAASELLEESKNA